MALAWLASWPWAQIPSTLLTTDRTQGSYSILKMKFSNFSLTFPNHIGKISLTVPNHIHNYSVTYFTYNNSVDLLKQATIKLQLKNITIIMQLRRINTDDHQQNSPTFPVSWNPETGCIKASITSTLVL